jgi:hypothetical protein
MRAIFINEEEEKDQLEFLVDDIFHFWDKWEDDEREGISVSRSGGAGGYKEYKIYFSKGGSDEFFVDGVNHLKDFRMKTFGEHIPFEWEWYDNFLIINTI